MNYEKPSAPTINNEYEIINKNDSDSIITGIPVNIINPINSNANNSMLESIDLNNSINSNHNENIAICTTCNFQFVRDEKDKGSRNYFTCEQCRKNYLLRACCQSCCIS